MFGLVKFMIKDDLKFNQRISHAARRTPRLLKLNQNKRHLCLSE